ncbi:FtsW/RodA/SpoVE family cell cycle protein [Patescibacteria group bacterium]|nr:FtsW/RodA/SpoVE family cell cycle protein [Patescibacteria group bacterium]
MKKGFLSKNKKIHKPDYFFLGVFIFIVIVGLIILTSASGISAYDGQDGNKYYYLINQLYKGVLPGILFFVLISFLFKNETIINFFKNKTPIIYFISLLLMIFVLVFGIEHGGATSWIDLHIFSFQPSEILKLTTILYFSFIFAKNNYKEDKNLLRFSLLLMGLGGLFIFLQPDLGTLMVYVAICLAVLFFVGIKFRYIFSIIFLGLFFSFFAITTGIVNENRIMRIKVWLNPLEYQNTDYAYQINQASIAIGSGGVFGKGIGNSIQKFLYLPEVSSDSVFAIAAEEFGFIFTTFFVLIYLIFILRGFYITKRLENEYYKYVVSGIMAFIGFQSFVNIATMTRILPLTGVPMPFMSYGNSLMLVMFVSVAIVFSFSRYTKDDIYNSKLKK